MGDVSSVLIAAKQLAVIASALNIPVFLVDVRGKLEFLNGAAERVLGNRYDEVGPATPAERGARWSPTNVEGAPIPVQHLPSMAVLRNRQPVHRFLNIVGRNGASQRLEVSAFPLKDANGELLGAVGFFWDTA